MTDRREVRSSTKEKTQRQNKIDKEKKEILELKDKSKKLGEIYRDE